MSEDSQTTPNERLAFRVASVIGTLIVLFAIVIQVMHLQAYYAADAVSLALLAFISTENIRFCKNGATLVKLPTAVVIILIGIMAMCYTLSTEAVAAKRSKHTTAVPSPHAAP